jgi:putative transposase
LKFSSAYSHGLKHRAPTRHDTCYLYEAVINIAVQKRWLRRAINQGGYVLDEIIQTNCNAKSTTRLINRQGSLPSG